MNDKLFHLNVIAREGVIFEGNVRSITSYNESGEFDVLSQHANFISLIRKKVSIRNTAGKKSEYLFDNALIKVLSNEVKIYLGIEGIMDTTPAYSE
jgi:F0F1-type ATP synthase epsilon subunit